MKGLFDAALERLSSIDYVCANSVIPERENLELQQGPKNVYAVPLVKYWTDSTRKPRNEYTVLYIVFALHWPLFFRLLLTHFRVPRVEVVGRWWVTYVGMGKDLWPMTVSDDNKSEASKPDQVNVILGGAIRSWSQPCSKRYVVFRSL